MSGFSRVTHHLQFQGTGRVVRDGNLFYLTNFMRRALYVDNSSSFKYQVRVKAPLGYLISGDLSRFALLRAGNIQIYQAQLHIG